MTQLFSARMQLRRRTITTTCAPTTDLGYLLDKHPDRPKSFASWAGAAHGSTRRRRRSGARPRCCPRSTHSTGSRRQAGAHRRRVAQYVNDRPYAASSMLAVAIRDAFRTALTGRCDARPSWPRNVSRSTTRAGPALPRRRDVAHRASRPSAGASTPRSQPLRPAEWGDSPHLDLRLTGELRLADALNHLYVLLPVLDDAKHYWVSTEEVDKLIRAGGDWLAGHPEKEPSPAATCRTRTNSPGPRWPGWPKPTTPTRGTGQRRHR